MFKLNTLVAALSLAFSLNALADNASTITFKKLWKHKHQTSGQLSEISAFDKKTNTIWVAGVVEVDVLNATTGSLLKHIDVTGYGFINSVAIHHGLAAFAVESKTDRRIPVASSFLIPKPCNLAKVRTKSWWALCQTC